MKISIVTVAYNAEKTISETIESVCSQSYSNIEYIVIDGASTDRTCEIIEEHKYRNKISRAISEADDGIYFAMNKGIAMSTGDVVGFLNADDCYAHSKVIEMIAAVFENQEIDCCYGDLYFINRKFSEKIIRKWHSNEYKDGSFEKGWMPPHPTLFVRKNFLEACSGFDTSYQMASDFDLCLRLLAKYRLRSQYIPSPLVLMKSGGVSSTIRGLIIGNLESHRACIRNNLKASILPLFVITKVFSKIQQFIK